jgi:predicted anti-sigma-YlaC factor YlaD
MSCTDAELLLGVLVLGVIDPPERHTVEVHLATCGRCAAVFADLAVLPGLLHRLDLQEATTGLPPVPPEFTARLLVAGDELTRARHRRRRRATVSAAVAAAVVLLTVGVALPIVLHRAPTDTVAAQAVPVVVSGTNPATSVSATVTLVPVVTGTSLQLALTGVEPGEHCQLVAIDATGHREVASTWVASYQGAAKVFGSTGLTQQSIQTLVVETNTGRTLVSLPVPHPTSA